MRLVSGTSFKNTAKPEFNFAGQRVWPAYFQRQTHQFAPSSVLLQCCQICRQIRQVNRGFHRTRMHGKSHVNLQQFKPQSRNVENAIKIHLLIFKISIYGKPHGFHTVYGLSVQTQRYCTISPLDVSQTASPRVVVVGRWVFAFPLAGKFILTMQIVSMPFVTSPTSPLEPLPARRHAPTQTDAHRDLSICSPDDPAVFIWTWAKRMLLLIKAFFPPKSRKRLIYSYIN